MLEQPRRKSLSAPTTNQCQIASLSDPPPRRTESFLNRRAFYGPSNLSLFTLSCCLEIALSSTPLFISQAYDLSNQRVSYYTESLMISRKSTSLPC